MDKKDIAIAALVGVIIGLLGLLYFGAITLKAAKDDCNAYWRKICPLATIQQTVPLNLTITPVGTVPQKEANPV